MSVSELLIARRISLVAVWRASASWISSNNRTFSIAITAWSAKVVTSSICLVVKVPWHKWTRGYPIGVPSLMKWIANG